jgi:MFS family permease
MNSIWEFYLYCGVLVGIGMSGMLSPLMSLIARWFVKRRSLMAGILASGPALGIAILPFLASLFISTVGWRMTYIILGCLILFVIVPSALFLKRDPEEINLQPYGTIQHSGMSSMQYEGLSLKRALCTGQFWTLGLVAFCAFFTINVYTVHIVIHAIGLEISSNTAATLLSLAAGISVIGRILVGAVADAIGNRRTIMLCFLMGAIAFMLITSSNEIAILYLGASIFGGTGWATGSLIAPLTASLFGLKSHGTILACIMMSATIGGAVGPVLIGYVFDITGSYHCGFIITIFACILAFTSSFLLKPVAERKKL